MRAIKNEKVDMVVGTSGTVSSIGMMVYSEFKKDIPEEFNLNNYTFDRASLNKAVKRILKSETIEERRNIPGLDEKRADIIVAGLILEQIVNELEIPAVTVSGYALREGILMDMINKETGVDNLGHLSDVRFKSVINLAKLCNFDKEHQSFVILIKNILSR